MEPSEEPDTPTTSGEGLVRVPKAIFIEDVASFLADRSADQAIKELNENYQQYKLIEQELQQRRARLLGKIPEIQKAVAAVDMLISKHEASQEVMLDFALSEQMYAKARVADVSSVALWLGADVMLEYPLQEAKELLSTNLQNARDNLKRNAEDMELIKDFSTTTEVSIARVYNANVVQKRSLTGSTGEEP